ncbi:MAG: hypothetical protein NW208_10805 [Bryobacter sp.]|nr:hypothetical protein [Bryobacter sp.]
METTQSEVEQLRAELRLVPVSKADEGLSWAKISNGVYGYTFTPADSDGGIYARNSFLSFEFHKLADGKLQFLGYTTPEFAEKLKSQGSPEIELYPVPVNDFTVLVAVPHARVASHKPLNRMDSNRLKVALRP